VNRVEETIRRIDRFQQRHAVLAFPYAVVQKFGNDQAGAKAALVAYYGLFALFPLLLLFTTIVGFLFHDHRQEIIDSALRNFPVIGNQLTAEAHPLTGSGFALVFGILGTIYGGLGVVQSAQVAMNSVWNIPYVKWPNFFFRRVRGLAVAALLGLAILGSATLSILATAIKQCNNHCPSGDGTTALVHGSAQVLFLVGSAALALVVFWAAFMVLTAEPLGWRDVWLGAVMATVFWMALQLIGTWYVTRVLHRASVIYGFFAVVIALLSWLFIGVQTTLYAAEINVVRNYRLWPRSMVQPPLTDADRRVFERLAAMEVRRPEVGVRVFFHDSADHDPLAAAEITASDVTPGDGTPDAGSGDLPDALGVEDR